MKKWFGVLIFVFLIGGVFVYRIVAEKTKSPYTDITIKGIIGSEKSNFLNNPEVKKILLDKYQLTVDFKTSGSIEMVQGDTKDQDFLWPSNSIALELFKTINSKVKSETIFNSPIVFYSWTPVVESLIKLGIVQKKDQIYYVVDMPRLAQMLEKGTKWSEIGLPQIYGNLSIISTDPVKSNSGNMFYALLSAMFNDGRVIDMDSVEKVLPKLDAYYSSLGYLEDGSAKLFKQFISAGMGDKPLIAGYESQIIEFILENPSYRELISKQIVMMYPEPTVWSSHPLISLNQNSDRLILSLQDPLIQNIAWKKHGFRTGLAGVQSNPEELGLTQIPRTIDSTLPLPRPEAMSRIIEYLKHKQQ
jgi:hypothetical protein